MKKILIFFLYWWFRILIALRYRIKVKGLEHLNSNTLNKKGGVLFLPNHPSVLIDPLIVALSVWRKYPIRPMVVEYMYYTPFVGWFLRLVNSLPVPDFGSSSNSLKRKKSDEMVNVVVDGLKHKENFLIYPAGKTKSTGLESIGGASAVQKIIHDVPEVNVVLVRIKGLWGSSFSRAFLGKAPPILPTLAASFKHLLKNLIFFSPRRDVIVELYPAPADFPYNASRLEMNKWLENWYNQPDGLTKQQGERPGDSYVLVSLSRWGYVVPETVKKEMVDQTVDLSKVPEIAKEKITKKLAELADMDKSKIQPGMDLASDLGLDSLDMAEMVGFIQDQFDIDNVPVHEMTTVGRIMGIASHQVTLPEKVVESTVDLSKWETKRGRKRVEMPPGKTMIEVFLNQAGQLKKEACCGDERLGVASYSQMKLRAIILAEYIRTLPGPYVGIMLPASVMANILVLAVQLAGKTPLMVNWTVGPRHLESVIKLSNVQTVLTSWAFLDKLDNIELNGMEDRLVMLEDLKHKFGLKQKLQGLYRSKLSNQRLMKLFKIDKKTEDDMAVLLFTSGTEGMPKGVPLTHKNIISNQKGIIDMIALYSDDVIHGILPPFHSFGFTVSGMLGTLVGIRIGFYPNPTEGKALAKSIERWKVTIGCGAPTFIKGILRAAEPEQLVTLRIFATGAERCPPELLELVAEKGKPGILTEGYGITECSPVLTFNTPGKPNVGVGKPAPEVELKIVHQETNEPLPLGERGMILAHGPNIFNGYINPGISSPFVYVDNKKWFKTGDLGYLDPEGNLTISGRLKRFVKIGGEMISLASIEEALFEHAVKHKLQLAPEGPSVAVAAKEQEGEKTKFYVFSVFKISVDEANAALKAAGFTNLVKVATVHQIPEMPLLGTGKINYRALESEFLAAPAAV